MQRARAAAARRAPQGRPRRHAPDLDRPEDRRAPARRRRVPARRCPRARDSGHRASTRQGTSRTSRSSRAGSPASKPTRPPRRSRPARARPIEPRPFTPVLRAVLLTEHDARWLQRDLSAEGGTSTRRRAARGLTWTKIAGRELSRHLERVPGATRPADVGCRGRRQRRMIAGRPRRADRRRRGGGLGGAPGPARCHGRPRRHHDRLARDEVRESLDGGQRAFEAPPQTRSSAPGRRERSLRLAGIAARSARVDTERRKVVTNDGMERGKPSPFESLWRRAAYAAASDTCTTRTGTWLAWRTRWLTLPSSSERSSPRPRDPITTRS